jgi:hypothetical protein
MFDRCFEVYDRYKERKAARILEKMGTASESKTATFKKQAEQLAGQVRENEYKINEAKAKARGRKLKPAERAHILEMMNTSKLLAKQKDKYDKLCFGAQSEQFGVKAMVTGKEVAKHNKVLVKGFKELKKEGYGAEFVHKSLDSLEDTTEEIGEINTALEERLGGTDAMSQEDVEQMEAELDAEFNDDSGSTKRALATLPVSNQTLKYVKLQEELPDDAIEMERVMIDSDA